MGVEIGHLDARGLTTVAAPVLVITVLVITVLVITVLVITMLVITVLVITVLVVAVLVVAVLVVAVLVLWVSVSVLAPMPVPQSVPVSVWSGPVGCLLLRTFSGVPCNAPVAVRGCVNRRIFGPAALLSSGGCRCAGVRRAAGRHRHLTNRRGARAANLRALFRRAFGGAAGFASLFRLAPPIRVRIRSTDIR